MAITEKAKAYREKMLQGKEPRFIQTDPEFIERFENFAFDEVVSEPGEQLDDKTRFIAILASLLGCQAVDEFCYIAEAAMNFGVTPVEIKEIVYQAVDYLGIGRVCPFLTALNELLKGKGIALPLEGQATTTTEDRLEKGIEIEKKIFGEDMEDFHKHGYMKRWLTANYYGDYYTRNGIDCKTREMITFCFLAAMGGAKHHLAIHTAGNIHVGNDKDFLIAVISQCLPFIGYPRAMAAVHCVKKVVKKMKEDD